MSLIVFPISKKATQANDQERKQLAEFLEPVSLRIYPMVAGKLPSLSKLPPRTDVHEWLATNCEYVLHTLITFICKWQYSPDESPLLLTTDVHAQRELHAVLFFVPNPGFFVP